MCNCLTDDTFVRNTTCTLTTFLSVTGMGIHQIPNHFSFSNSFIHVCIYIFMFNVTYRST